MKNNPFTGKSTRTKIFTVITVCAIILLLALNLFLTSFGIFGNAYIDLTPEGLYTLTPEMKDVCDDIFYMSDGTARDPGIKITFCDDPDNLISKTSTRLIYYMATALSKRFKNCDVEYYNVNMNPTALAKYKTTSLSQIKSDDVIISYGSRYSIVSADEFWHIGSDNVVYAFDGEYKLASIMLSLTLVDRPVAYFVTDHGETYYDAADPANEENNKKTGAFAELLVQRGFELKTLSLGSLIENAEEGKAPAIPDDCVLLIINNPREDFASDPDKLGSFGYVSQTDLLDKFMIDDRGSIMVSFDYKLELPNFEDFLAEWSIKCTDTLVKDSINSIDDGLDTTLIADYNLNEETYAYAIYGEYASRSSSPRVIIENTGAIVSAYGESEGSVESGTPKTSRLFTPFLYSSKEAKQYGVSNSGVYNALAAEGQAVVAAIGGRQTIDEDTGEYSYSYIFCAASPDFFSGSTVGNPSYANFDVISALVQNIARLETHADSSLGGLSMNNSDDKFGGKMLVVSSRREDDKVQTEYDENGKRVTKTYLGLTAPKRVIYTVIIFAIPLAILVVGVVMHIKRKYL